MRKPRVTACAAVVPLLLLAACTLPVKPKDSAIAPGAVTAFENAAPVAVRAVLVGRESRTIPVAGGKLVVNEDDFSGAMVSRMIAALETHGVPVEDASPRIIEIQVVRVSIHTTASFDCVIDFNRRLGGGPLRGMQARAGKWDIEKACGDATSQAAIEALMDADMRAYLTGG